LVVAPEAIASITRKQSCLRPDETIGFIKERGIASLGLFDPRDDESCYVGNIPATDTARVFACWPSYRQRQQPGTFPARSIPVSAAAAAYGYSGSAMARTQERWAEIVAGFVGTQITAQMVFHSR
jgi:hypothetical protein